MSLYFLDTSALAKRYMPETGTKWVRQLTSTSARNNIFIAQITPVELFSAIARQYHDEHIGLSVLKSFRRLFTRHTKDQYLTLSLSNIIVERALSLHETHRLRAYDSIQLASALELKDRLTVTQQKLTFVASDTRLLKVASLENLITDDPINHV